MTEKLIRNGCVAVLYSPGYGAGWSTWDNEYSQAAMVFDPEIAQAVEDDDFEAAHAIAARKYPCACLGGIDQLCVKWLPKGTQFRIDEYDGSESVIVHGPTDYLVA